MWIFKNNSFFSAVENRDDKTQLMIRARRKQDLINAFGDDIDIIQLRNADYKYRIIIDKKTASQIIAESIMNIDYDNFKNSISKKESDRHSAYCRVWSDMYSFQE